MLSILCDVDFREKDDFRNTKSFEKLNKNEHLENLCENAFFHEFMTFLKETNSQALDLDTKKSNLQSFIGNQLSQTDLKQELISLGISCIQSFAQINWLGPLPAQFSNLPTALRDLNLEQPNPSLRVFNLIDHFELNSKVLLCLLLIQIQKPALEIFKNLK